MASSASLWLGFVVSQQEKSVCSQNQHLPQEIVNGTTTRSPFLTLHAFRLCCQGAHEVIWFADGRAFGCLIQCRTRSSRPVK